MRESKKKTEPTPVEVQEAQDFARAHEAKLQAQERAEMEAEVANRLATEGPPAEDKVKICTYCGRHYLGSSVLCQACLIEVEE